jgi:hypothetical protein
MGAIIFRGRLQYQSAEPAENSRPGPLPPRLPTSERERQGGEAAYRPPGWPRLGGSDVGGHQETPPVPLPWPVYGRVPSTKLSSTMSKRPKLQKLTISLLKDDLYRLDALRERDEFDGYLVPTIDKKHDTLFVRSHQPHRPSWDGYLSPHVSQPIEDVYTASSSAVLLF